MNYAKLKEPCFRYGGLCLKKPRTWKLLAYVGILLTRICLQQLLVHVCIMLYLFNLCSFSCYHLCDSNLLDNFYDQESGRNGCVCIFSLKNPSYPEYLCQAQSGVICVDIHPDHPHMLAAGLSDGNVAVYNLQKNPQKPSYISTAKNGKHTDIVWQVKWIKDNLDGYLNFFSVSGDGRVTNWTIVKTALWYTDTLNINFSKSLHNFSEEDTKTILKGIN